MSTRVKKPLNEMEFILATDVGSTTTKARFFQRRDEGWRYVTSGEAPTTVEAPFEDVTMGVLNAVREVEELIGHRLISEDGQGIIVPFDGEKGVDLYCTTSSAGGGLQMMVAGVVMEITAASANRAVLGAGAIVMDILSLDDGRQTHQRITRIKNLRPDMMLLAGGTDGGTVKHVLKVAETISAAKPKCRLGEAYRLPLVYAGNVDARSHVKDLFENEYALVFVENIRPTLEEENIEPARRIVHELFMEHVMSHAPGYTKLMKWTDVDIMPTPAGEGMAMQLIADMFKANVLGVGLGGATTNVYSVFDGRFVRSVSANLGMSYSISNVLKESGIDNFLRWLPFRVDRRGLQHRVKNKMIRPTTIPQTLQDLMIEHAVAREALRLGLEHHRTIATRLKGTLIERNVGEILKQELEETYVKMMNVDIICGTGGLLSHAPRRAQAMLILIDAFQPEGITRMFQDSVFMMPHLGVLSTVYREAARQIFEKDCLVPLGTAVAPSGQAVYGSDALELRLERADGTAVTEKVRFGEMRGIPLGAGEEAILEIHPRRGLDVGRGGGRSLRSTVHGGVVGLVIDARGRPLTLPSDDEERSEKLREWFNSLAIYPDKQ